MDELQREHDIVVRERAARYRLTTRCLRRHPYVVERIRPSPVQYQLRIAFSAPEGLQRYMKWTDDLECNWAISWHRNGNVTSGVSISSSGAGCEISIDEGTRWFVGVKTDCTFLIAMPEQQTTARLHGGFLASRHVIEVNGSIVAVGLYHRSRCTYPIVVRRRCPFDERICIALYLSMIHWPHQPPA